MAEKLSDKKLVFITGPAGSGTTMLSRLLSAPDFALGLTRYSNTAGYERQSEYIDQVTHRMWHESNTDRKEKRMELGNYLRDVPVGEDFSHVILKRSCPFTNLEYIPVLSDIPELFPQARFIISKRDPRSCATSLLRRKICEDIDAAIHWTKTVFQYLHEELNKLDSSVYHVIRYEEFIGNPGKHFPEIERFIGYPGGALTEYSSMIKSPTVASRKMAQDFSEHLDMAFDGYEIKF